MTAKLACPFHPWHHHRPLPVQTSRAQQLQSPAICRPPRLPATRSRSHRRCPIPPDGAPPDDPGPAHSPPSGGHLPNREEQLTYVRPRLRKMGKVGKGIRIKAQKGKKWKKGQSCSTNPETSKHRQAARSRFFNTDGGSGGLTVEALATHDAADGDDVAFSDIASETKSQGGKTFNTWASNWTECTNATFGKVHRYWKSNLALHKEILAVLAAVTEVIKVKGGKETETEYFGALMTALDTMEGDDSLAAVAYLLNLAVKRVPVSVLKSRFSVTAKSLLTALAKNAETPSPSMLRALLMSIGHVLRVQDQAVWSNSSTTQIYDGLLSFVAHSKPKVRKAAQHAVLAVLKGSSFMTGDDPPPYHPAASATAKYCIHQIEESGGSTDFAPTLHALGLLKDVMGGFPQHSLKSTCETILRVMTLANVVVTSVAMKALHGMFVSRPSPTSLPAELNAQIITALYDYQPGDNDLQPMKAWLAVMEQALVNLSRVKDSLCMSHLPRFFSAAMSSMPGGTQDGAEAAAKTLITLLKECVRPMADKLAAAMKAAPQNFSTPAHKMFRVVEGGLSYQYHACWGLVLSVLATFFEVLGKQCHPIMRKCLVSMAGLRDSHGFAFIPDLDRAFGAAVHAMGPRVVLEAVPLKITGEGDSLDLPRSWLMPVLRDNIRDTELGFFTAYFLPLAAKLRTKSLEYTQSGHIVQAKTYDALQLQIWSLLPGFCTSPTDLKQSFRGIAKILGSAVSDRRDIRLDILASLRKLITLNLDHEENRAELANFAKNFLPLLFNLYSTDPEQEKDPLRQAVLETVKVYLQIASSQLIGSYFDKMLSKISEEDTTDFRRHALMDLSITMVPYLETQRLSKLYDLVLGQLQSEDRTIQKKSYRVLEDICSSTSQECKDFVSSHLQELQDNLLKSLSSSKPSSKAPRLRCLINIFQQLEDSQLEFLSCVVPEAILCTKETAEKARTAAYNLLLEMARALLRWLGEESSSEGLNQYFELILAGLAGSTHLVVCTVQALSRLIFEFKDMVEGRLLMSLLDNTCVLMGSKTREVVRVALGLLKVIMSVFKDTDLAPGLRDLVKSLLDMTPDNRRHLRLKVRDTFARLIRKFGVEVIRGMVPEREHKMVAYIRKMQERAKKKKLQKPSEGDSDDDGEVLPSSGTKPSQESLEDLLRDTDSESEEDEKETKAKKKVKGRKEGPGHKSTWLKEGDDDDIVDFLDASVSKKVMATKPNSAKGSQEGGKVKHDFKVAPDGRLIITMGEDEDEEKQPKEAPVIDDLSELLDAMQGPSKKNRKRKVEENEDDDPMEYKAGGKGIHRPLQKKGKPSEDAGKQYQAKKAGGDIKKSGRPDPFAYVPLEMSNLNRRKRAKNRGQFKNLVSGAKRGAVKGQKMRTKQRK